MQDYDQLSADQILTKVISDGVVDSHEISALERKLGQDWVVDRQEIELLFRVNHALGEKDTDCAEWTRFFVDHVSRLLIHDLDSPGEIDESEGDWLADVLDQFGVANTTESELLSVLQDNCSGIRGRVSQRLSSQSS